MPRLAYIAGTVEPAEIAVNIAGMVIVGMSIFLMVRWLTKYGGPAVLNDIRPRRNSLPLYLPFLVISGWIILTFSVRGLLGGIFARQPQWKQDAVLFISASVVELALIPVMIVIGRYGFVRGVRGFGLDLRRAGRDFLPAAVNLVAVYPLLNLAILPVTVTGQYLHGDQFRMQENAGLTILQEIPDAAVKVYLVVFFVAVVPVFEEILFRGILQSVLRSYIERPWRAIMAASAVFAVMHPWMHWGALFVLAAALGYSYERSGSLLRPIFIHIFFNATNITVCLLSGQGAI